MIRNPEVVVFGRLGRRKSPALVPLDGKSALARWLDFDALRLSGRPVAVLDKSEPTTARYELALDEIAGCELLDLSAYDGAIDPLAFGHARSSSSGDTAGEW